MNKIPWSLPALLCSVALVIFASTTSFAQTSAFNYQGKLTDGSSAATGSYQMQFALFDASTGGSQVGSTLIFNGASPSNPSIQVTNGIFSVILDFGATPFAWGQTVYLEIRVKKSSDVSYTTLTPRQRVVGVPYAQRSVEAGFADLAGDSLGLGGYSATDFFLKSGGNISGNISVSGTSTLGSLSVTGLAVGGSASVTGALTSGSLSTGAVSATGNAAIGGNATVGGNLTVSGALSGDGSGLTNVASTGSKWSIITSPTPASSNKSYITDGGSEVTVTLPSSPNPGDTVRVMGNLRDTGWKLAQNSGQVVVTNGSDFNYKFEARGPVKNYSAIASSADGMKLIAAANPGGVYTSTDAGLTWTNHFTDTDRAWSSVASSADGNNLVAAVNGGYFYISTDGGTNWTQSASTGSYSSVAISTDGTTIGVLAPLQLQMSFNSGANWTIPYVPPPIRFSSALALSASGTNILIAGANTYIGVSGDAGYTFNYYDYYRLWRAVTSSADGSRLAAVVYGGQVFTSTNGGVGWSARESNRNWSDIASSTDGAKLVAVVNGGKIYSSIDFGNWTALESDRAWSSVAMSSDGTRVSATVNGGQVYVSIPGSTLGASGYLRGAATASIELSYLGGGKWIVVDQAGSITYY